MMIKKQPNELMKEIEELGVGPLTLIIACTKCDKQFELDRQGCALAWITGASFIEYLRFVQSSKCPNCGKE